MPKTFVPLTGAAKLLHVPYYVAKRSLDTSFPTPDVAIDGLPGWEPERIIEFGIEVGLLYSDGTRSDTKRLWEQGLTLKWLRPIKQYLGKDSAAKIVGLEPQTLYIRHNKGQFIEPDVYVGRTVGWEKNNIMKWAAQMGKLS